MLTKIGRLIGLTSAVGALVLYGMVVWFNPYAPGSLTLPIGFRMLVGLVGLWLAYKGRPYLMTLVFILSFVPLGLYMLGTPGLFRWIGILDLAYLAASLMILVDTFRTKSFARVH